MIVHPAGRPVNALTMDGACAADFRTALAAVQHRHLRALVRAGVQPSSIVRSLLGVARIRAEGDLAFVIDPAGEEAVILPILRRLYDSAGMPERTIVENLIAWHPDQPGRWWVRRDRCATFLGLDARREAEETGEALPVYRTPLRYLQHGADGIVVLHPDFTWLVLAGLPAIIAEDIVHGEQLREQLPAADWPTTRILVPRRALA